MVINKKMKTERTNVVVHDVNVWLPRTKTWLYSEVTGVGPDWDSWVVANRTQNLSEFPYDKVFSLRDHHGYLRWIFEQSSFRLGITMQCPSIRRFIEKIRPDMLHSHFGTIGWRNIELAESISAKHVVSFYGVDVTKVPLNDKWRKRYFEMFDRVDAVLCEGPHMAYTIQKLGCPKEKICLYHLGVDLQAIKFKSPSWIRGKVLRILMAATFTEKKGFPYGLEAIASFIKKKKDIDLRLTIVGDSYKSKESQKEKVIINKAIKDNKLNDVVVMKGFCSHSALLALASEHDIFLSPSVTADDGDTEGGAPVSIIEMAASGLIIVSTKHCDIPNVLGKKNGLLLVNERDSNALANTMEWLVENPDQWQAIANENRQLIEQEFNIKNQGPALIKIYNRLLSI